VYQGSSTSNDSWCGVTDDESPVSEKENGLSELARLLSPKNGAAQRLKQKLVRIKERPASLLSSSKTNHFEESNEVGIDGNDIIDVSFFYCSAYSTR
jgi:hypothetical protein